ncbi:translocation/assembly module TamB domain-containing protein [Oceanibacterium hippocampi]|uniref:Translocation and assembly module TamB n=1 Tax=Oceanibacterium hippocampi TaxID=745714 RepID=A0A1Y5SQ00_9PROT|nr:translocation/assembly module TamB domain-containing protein [Oceanibacterium hippocampi]SLN45598.1 Translocation and assembly module TamB [Oceanibacterium hippocampi]
MMRRRLIRILLIVLVLLVPLGVTVVALLDSDYARRKAIALAVDAAAEAGVRLEIDALDWSLGGRFSVTGLRLADGRGPFLSLDRLDLDWRPGALLDRRVEVGRLALGNLDILRAPELPPAEPAPAEPAGDGGLLPELPVDIVLESLTAERIGFGEPLFGQAMAIDLDASASLLRALPEMTATVRSKVIEGGEGTLALDLGFAPATDRLQLSLDLAEPENGIVAGLLALDGRPPVSLAVTGNGSLSDWTGDIALAAGPDLALDGPLSIRAVEGGAHRLVLTGRGRVAALLPPEALEAAGEVRSLSLAATVDDAGAAREIVLSLDLPAGQLRLSGAVDPTAGDLDMRYSLLLPDGAALADLTGGAVFRDGRLDGHAGGTISSPSVEARMTLGSPGLDSMAADSVRLDLQATTGQDGALAFTLAGVIARPTLGDPALDPLLADGVTLDAAGSLDGAYQQLRLERIALQAAAATLGGEGELALDSGEGRISARLDAPTLDRYAALAGIALSGAGGLDIGADLGDFGATGSADIRYRLAPLKLGIPEADRLLVKGASGSARAAWQADGAVDLSSLSLDLDGLSLTADGRLAADGALKAKADIALSDLARLRIDGLAGRLDIAATASGTIEAPTARVVLSSPELVYGAERLQALKATVTGALPADGPSANLDLAARLRDQEITARGDLRTGKDGRISVDAVRVSLPGTDIEAELQLDPETMLASGDVRIRASDLTPAGRLAGLDIGGRLGADILLTADGRQGLGYGLRAEDLRLEGESVLTVGSIESSGAVGDLLALDGIDASASLRDLDAGGARIAEAEASVAGALSAVSFRASASGEAEMPFRVETAGRYGAVDTGQQVDIAQFSGAFGSIDFAAGKPFRLTMGGSGDGGAATDLALDGLLLDVGGGRLGADLALAGEKASGAIRIDALPLGLLAAFDPPVIPKGTLTARLDLDGLVAAPVLDGEVRVAGLIVEALEDSGARPLDLTLRFGYRDRLLEAAIEGGGGAALDINGKATLGADLTLMPFAFTPRDDGQLAGDIRASSDLAELSVWIFPEDRRVGGRLDLDARVRGTAGTPIVEGRLALADGVFEDSLLGLRIDDITVAATGSGDRLELTTLGATTPNGGTIGGEGSLVLGSDGVWTSALKLRADKAQLAALDIATVVASADLGLDGRLDALELAGTVTIDSAEIRIPETLPVDIPTVEIREVNNGTPVNEPTPEEEGAVAMTAALDVKVLVPQGVFVRGRGIDVEFGGEIDVGGTTADPSASGALGLRRGTMDLLGRSFTFDKGTISFENAPAEEPEVDIEASAGDQSFKAIVSVTGPVSKPEIAVSSEPELPQDEVIARLLFGKSAGELSALEAAQLAASAAKLAGVGGGGRDYVGDVRDRLGLDVLRFSGGDAGGGPAVEAGRYVADGVFVGVKQGAEAGSSKVTVEVEVTPNITVESSVGAQSQGNVGVRMEWDY